MRRLLVVALVVLLFPTATAQAAGTYAVDVCATAEGALATNGRYAYADKFRAESIGRRLRLRADAAHPCSRGYSKVVGVRAR